MPFTDQQLHDFWYGIGGTPTAPTALAYMTMDFRRVREATDPTSAGYLGPNWSAMLDFCYANRLFGFADYVIPPGGIGGPASKANNKFTSYAANISIHNGPIRSF